MAGAAIPPFPLFVLSEDIDVDYVNDVLRRTTESNYNVHVFVVVSIREESYPYACGPQRAFTKVGDESRVLSGECMIAVPDSYVSPFVGKTLEDCAAYLSGTPEDIVWETKFFCALDKYSKEDDTVTLVRILLDDTLHAIPEKTSRVAGSLMTYLRDDYERSLERYQRICRREGKPDRSVGVPWTGPWNS
ncbi:hypothetical protein K445DRAFT_12807 [Daldinia sp. EC12]|nr:hypothetical protein K445DRAFT_12807 [Daldinia sp. EC12]